jgi:hypothetical protein
VHVFLVRLQRLVSRSDVAQDVARVCALQYALLKAAIGKTGKSRHLLESYADMLPAMACEKYGRGHLFLEASIVWCTLVYWCILVDSFFVSRVVKFMFI